MPSPAALIALTLMLVSLLTTLFLGLELKRCVSRVKRLDSPEQIIAYRRVVARQMYGALIIIALAVIAAIVMLVAAVSGNANPADWFYIIGFSILYIIVGAWSKSVERKAQAISAEGDFARQRDEIVQVWLKKPLPIW